MNSSLKLCYTLFTGITVLIIAVPATAQTPANNNQQKSSLTSSHLQQQKWEAKHSPELHSKVLLDRLEIWDVERGTGQAWKASAYVGTDIHRLSLRSESTRTQHHTESSELEAYYEHSFTPQWDIVMGLKQEFRPIHSRTSVGLGIEGVTPHDIELSANAYFTEAGYSHIKFAAEYELEITQRLILQPAMEAQVSFKEDIERAQDNGLNQITTDLRLRYEITKNFAPYIGISHQRYFGNLPTADNDDWQGRTTHDTHWIVGVRIDI